MGAEFEFRVILVECRYPKLIEFEQRVLPYIGSEGWELVSTLNDFGEIRFYFKRSKSRGCESATPQNEVNHHG